MPILGSVAARPTETVGLQFLAAAKRTMAPSTGSSDVDTERRAALPGGMAPRAFLWLVFGAPLLGLLAVVGALTVYCHGLLEDAAAGRIVTIGDVPLLLVASTFLFASGVIVAVQSLRVASRIAGPEYRLRQALQRIVAGDLAFRVELRRGDLLTGIARDCNELLDWLNDHPPRSGRNGSDAGHVPTEPTAVGAPTSLEAAR